MTTRRFREIIWGYYRHHKRAMPWRRAKDPYRILVSEVMLQQTQVSRVLKFYPDFIKKFPDVRSLADARTGTVLRAWQGLGYNRRALALQKLSRIVLGKFNGRLPRDRSALESLPGIGKGTSGALRAFAWNEPAVFIETNIRRVFLHFFFPRRRNVTDKELERCIKRALPQKNPREWYFALMDYGAMLGGTAKSRGAAANPNRRSAQYKKQAAFKGSDRELRGKILSILLKRKRVSLNELSRETGETQLKVRGINSALEKEGFIRQNKDSITCA
jgi:A/G-specific adenine glycosylase